MLSTSVVSFKMADSSSDSDDVGEKSLQKGEKRRQEESDEDSDEDSSSEVNTDGSDESFDENMVRADHSYFADVFLTKFFFSTCKLTLIEEMEACVSADRGLCVYQENASDTCVIPWYTTRKRCRTITNFLVNRLFNMNFYTLKY